MGRKAYEALICPNDAPGRGVAFESEHRRSANDPGPSGIEGAVPIRWTCSAVARDNVHTPADQQPGLAYRLGMSMLFFAALSGLGLVAWKFVVHGPWWVFAGVVLFILWWFEGPGK
jgi:hypothetical protein